MDQGHNFIGQCEGLIIKMHESEQKSISILMFVISSTPACQRKKDE